MSEQGFHFIEAHRDDFDVETTVTSTKHDLKTLCSKLSEIKDSWVKEFYTHIERADDPKSKVPRSSNDAHINKKTYTIPSQVSGLKGLVQDVTSAPRAAPDHMPASFFVTILPSNALSYEALATTPTLVKVPKKFRTKTAVGCEPKLSREFYEKVDSISTNSESTKSLYTPAPDVAYTPLAPTLMGHRDNQR
ncbi:hypothetical protein V6N13_104397 [Hibiscus sabdariffa]|uniref:Uncharacterized protein n=2 Tax=Hibiscus sabdariffa TaxID=183260 RepID=A0ABR2DKU1_9ROSI